MDELFAIAGIERGKRGRPLRLLIIIAALTFAIASLSASRALAAGGDDSLPPGVGSLQDYMHEGEPPGHVYTPQPQNVPAEVPGQYGAPGFYRAHPSYGAPSDSQIATGAAVVGALIVAAWAYQQYQAHRQQRRALRRYRGHHPHRAIPPPPSAYGF